MVRSQGETNPPPNLLALAERFRLADKYFDVSLAEIERRLDADGGEYECRSEVDVLGEDGAPIAAELRLNINCRSAIRITWSVSIKLHRIRIDCIDHERRFPIGDRAFGSGWHRHTWDAQRGDCENRDRGKQPLSGFSDHLESRAEFLLRVFKELRVLLNRQDHGTDQLSFT
jgi:hypothetical protein